MKRIWKWLLIFLVLIVFVIGLFFVNKYFKVGNINITFFDEQKENIDIKNFTENLIRQNSGSFVSFETLGENFLSKKVHDEFPIVDTIQMNKNLDMSMDVIITKNQKFFSTCMDGDQFLVKCALGNQNGVFYQEVGSTASDTLDIKVVEDAIYDTQSQTQIQSPDSISLNRIYTKADFANLRELVNYFKKSYDLKKVEVEKLKIAKIYLNDFYIIVNMQRSFVDTIKDFELISRTGDLKDYLNDKPKDILYVDLSYKNKVFFKLNKTLENVIMSTTTDAR